MLRLIESAQVLALDLETTGLSPVTDRVRLLSLSNGNQGGWAVLDCFKHDLRPAVPGWRPDTPARRILPALRGKTLVCHNAAFDLGFLYHLGLTDIPETVCTYLLAQLLVAG